MFLSLKCGIYVFFFKSKQAFKKSVWLKLHLDVMRRPFKAVLRNNWGPTMERIRKKITKVFHADSLRITSECNLSRTDFLDVCFDSNKETYIPYRKPNNTPIYIHVRPNHPLLVKKRLPQISDTKYQIYPATKQHSKKRPLSTINLHSFHRRALTHHPAIVAISVIAR